MQQSPTAAPWGRVKTALAAIALAFGASACAQMEHLASNQATGCRLVSAESPQRLVIEADIAAFASSDPSAGSARFEVQDCLMDGQFDGKTIIVSSRLARLPQAQRHFIIAHEFAHHELAHPVRAGAFPARILSQQATAIQAADVTDHAHRTEFEADAYAVRSMHARGLDPEEAARLFDGMGAGKDSDTHPAFSRRAEAIRAVISSLPASTGAPASAASPVAGRSQPATPMQ